MDTIGASKVMRFAAFDSRTHAGRRGIGGTDVSLNHVHSRGGLPSGDCYVFQAADRRRSRPRVAPDEVVARARLRQALDETLRPGPATLSADTAQPMTGDAGRTARSAAWVGVAGVAGGGAGVMGVSAAAPMRICAGGLAVAAVASLYLCFAAIYGWSPFRRRSARRERAQEEASENAGVAEPAPLTDLAPEQNGERRWFAELRLSLRIGRRSR